MVAGAAGRSARSRPPNPRLSPPGSATPPRRPTGRVDRRPPRQGGGLARRPRPRQARRDHPPPVIRAAVVHALGAPAAAFWRIDVAPLARVALTGRGGRWQLSYTP
ncbi:hypothetical protein ACFQX6_19370 [Streptosporangium lutulentum]